MHNEREKSGFSPINTVFQTINLLFRFEKPSFSIPKAQFFEKLGVSVERPGFSIEKLGLSKTLLIKFDKPGFSIWTT